MDRKLGCPLRDIIPLAALERILGDKFKLGYDSRKHFLQIDIAKKEKLVFQLFDIIKNFIFLIN